MKILVINPFGIGDVIFTTPVIKALKEAYNVSIAGETVRTNTLRE